MEELIPMNEYGLMAGKDFIARVDSHTVADVFEKQHSHVLRDIKKIAEGQTGLSEEFRKSNFGFSTYVTEQGHKAKCCLMTRDGFTILATGFTGKKADAFKEAYIKRFNEMEQHIQMLQSLRDQNPWLTEAIKETREDAKPYNYSNEADMINRIVLGMTARKYRETYSIPKSDPIRPHMTADEAELMDRLQTLDIGFQYTMPDHQQRKQLLELYAYKWREKKALPVAVSEGDHGTL